MSPPSSEPKKKLSPDYTALYPRRTTGVTTSNPTQQHSSFLTLPLEQPIGYNIAIIVSGHYP
jgi:hypothetical protein